MITNKNRIGEALRPILTQKRLPNSISSKIEDITIDFGFDVRIKVSFKGVNHFRLPINTDPYHKKLDQKYH